MADYKAIIILTTGQARKIETTDRLLVGAGIEPSTSGGTFGLGVTAGTITVGQSGQITQVNSVLEVPGTGTDSLRLGRGTSATTSASVAVGVFANATTGAGALAFGGSANATSTGALAFGGSCTASADGSVAIGSSGLSSGIGAIGVGNSVSAVGTYSLAIGQDADTYSGDNGSIALGFYAKTSGAGQLVVGGDLNAPYTLLEGYFGRGPVSATPGSGFSINATGGSGTNIAGASLIIAGGKATGNAAGGSVQIQTSTVGSSGTTLQTLTTRVIITNTGSVGIGQSDPQGKLDVVGTGTFLSQFLSNTTTTGAAGLFFTETSSGGGTPFGIIRYGSTHSTEANHAEIYNYSSGGSLKFGTNNAERLRILSTGNVGIGTSSPSTFKLEVAGDIGPEADNTRSLGSSSRRITSLHLGTGSLFIRNDAADTAKTTFGYGVIDSTATITIGATTATTITIGRSGQTTNIASAATFQSSASFEGDVTLGNASTDALVFTGYISSANVFFTKQTNHTIRVEDTTTSNTVGAELNFTGAAGAGTGTGGLIALTAGTAGATGSGGTLFLIGGLGGATSGGGGNIDLQAGGSQSSGFNGGQLVLKSGSGFGSSSSGPIHMYAGMAGSTGNGNQTLITGGYGGGTSGNGGDAIFKGGLAQGGNSNGGDAYLHGGDKTGTGINGAVRIGTSSTSALVVGMAGAPMNFGQATVSQATNSSTAVTINASSGVISTVTLTAAARSIDGTFTVNNSCVTSASVISLTVGNYSGTYFTNGTPDVRVGSVSSGSFTVSILNIDNTNALNGSIKIYFTAL